MALCASVVVYHPHQEPLHGAYEHLQDIGGYIECTLRKFWLREYQMFTNRVHPQNNTSASSGHMLTATRVEALSMQAVDESQSKRIKMDEGVL